MNSIEIKNEILKEKYNFLYENEFLGKNIILLGLGGSHAYGTNNENSDIDIRGIAVNSPKYLFTGRDFEQVVETETDTTVYSLDKMITLLASCNPNTVEILGLRPEHYLKLTPEGQLLLDNKELFLSRRATFTFGGYANSQLRRLENKAARELSQAGQERNILKSIEHAQVDFHNKYLYSPDDSLRLYVDKAINEDMDTEIFMDANFKHYPLRDYRSMWNEMHAIVKGYARFGSRNTKAIEHNKLGKHMMHLVRLYYMCFDILERHEIKTYREEEHDFLMDIRNGKYLDENKQPIPEFYEIVDGLEKRLDYANKYTDLPEKVDYDKIYDLQYEINRSVYKGE